MISPLVFHWIGRVTAELPDFCRHPRAFPNFLQKSTRRGSAGLITARTFPNEPPWVCGTGRAPVGSGAGGMSVSRTDVKVFSGSPSLSISLCFMSASQQVEGERGRDDDGVSLGLILTPLRWQTRSIASTERRGEVGNMKQKTDRERETDRQTVAHWRLEWRAFDPPRLSKRADYSGQWLRRRTTAGIRRFMWDWHLFPVSLTPAEQNT